MRTPLTGERAVSAMNPSGPRAAQLGGAILGIRRRREIDRR